MFFSGKPIYSQPFRCPFDPNHIMPRESFTRHVSRCNSTLKKKFKRCPYNVYHYIIKEEFDEHCQNCQFRSQYQNKQITSKWDDENQDKTRNISSLNNDLLISKDSLLKQVKEKIPNQYNNYFPHKKHYIGHYKDQFDPNPLYSDQDEKYISDDQRSNGQRQRKTNKQQQKSLHYHKNNNNIQKSFQKRGKQCLNYNQCKNDPRYYFPPPPPPPYILIPNPDYIQYCNKMNPYGSFGYGIPFNPSWNAPFYEMNNKVNKYKQGFFDKNDNKKKSNRDDKQNGRQEQRKKKQVIQENNSN